jgi:hypothetical protein
MPTGRASANNGEGGPWTRSADALPVSSPGFRESPATWFHTAETCTLYFQTNICAFSVDGLSQRCPAVSLFNRDMEPAEANTNTCTASWDGPERIQARYSCIFCSNATIVSTAVEKKKKHKNQLFSPAADTAQVSRAELGNGMNKFRRAHISPNFHSPKGHCPLDYVDIYWAYMYYLKNSLGLRDGFYPDILLSSNTMMSFILIYYYRRIPRGKHDLAC